MVVTSNLDLTLRPWNEGISVFKIVELVYFKNYINLICPYFKVLIDHIVSLYFFSLYVSNRKNARTLVVVIVVPNSDFVCRDSKDKSGTIVYHRIILVIKCILSCKQFSKMFQITASSQKGL